VSLPIVWLILAVCALVVEALTSTLIFLFVAAAALLGALASLLHVPVSVQVVGFAAAALGLPLLFRPRLLQRMGGRGLLSRTETLLGSMGRVTESIDPVAGTGRVLVNGEDWAARSAAAVAAGTQVRVEGADGIVLLVAATIAQQPASPSPDSTRSNA
jgi:membrane protein implicated in regulation of membrane protease activity